MDVKNWYRSFSTRSTRSIQLGRNYQDEVEGVKETVFSKSGGSKSSIWKVLWKKLTKEKKEKKKGLRLEFSRSVHVQNPRYNEYTYAQNFDNGFNSDEPDHLFKSFSVRFADPSKYSF
ncbi:hypothetical protein A4A49_37464 [Nicotiana attenuata]|uniref:Uncharacterized protein n=1 Tax=Nicotiana attenuata TaxID=49451 RepID=A0A1J6JTU1_NICAT|nr:hypothetical protein A4A49_37464 [Nicotiana attenuata]